jgi:hypothetical protein
MDRNELPFEPRHLGVQSGASKTISEAMVHLAQMVHLSCTETNTVSKRIETSFHLSLVTQEYLPVHLKQFLSASKIILHEAIECVQKISELTVRMAQTMHLSCTETNTIYKRTERKFYMTHVT